PRSSNEPHHRLQCPNGWESNLRFRILLLRTDRFINFRSQKKWLARINGTSPSALMAQSCPGDAINAIQDPMRRSGAARSVTSIDATLATEETRDLKLFSLTVWYAL